MYNHRPRNPISTVSVTLHFSDGRNSPQSEQELSKVTERLAAHWAPTWDFTTDISLTLSMHEARPHKRGNAIQVHVSIFKTCIEFFLNVD